MVLWFEEGAGIVVENFGIFFLIQLHRLLLIDACIGRKTAAVTAVVWIITDGCWLVVLVCIASSLIFETQEELNAWKSAFEVGISYALGDNEACIGLFVDKIKISIIDTVCKIANWRTKFQQSCVFHYFVLLYSSSLQSVVDWQLSS